MGGLFAKLPTKSVLVIGLDGSGKSALLSAARGIFRDDLTGSLPGVVRSELIDPTADIARAAVVREELDRIVQRDDVQQKNIPILFILNKIDIQKDEDEELVQKLTPQQVEKMLQLQRRLGGRTYSVLQASALSGSGVTEAFSWLDASTKDL